MTLFISLTRKWVVGQATIKSAGFKTNLILIWRFIFTSWAICFSSNTVFPTATVKILDANGVTSLDDCTILIALPSVLL